EDAEAPAVLEALRHAARVLVDRLRRLAVPAYLEDVPEVGGRAQLDHQHDRLVQIALDLHVVVQALADQALPDDGEALGRERLANRVTEQVHGVVVLGSARRQRAQTVAIEPELVAREEASVLEVQALLAAEIH